MGRLEELRLRFGQEPLGIFIGATLEELKEGYAIVGLRVRKEFLVMENIVQGGITTTLADFAGVYAAMSKIPRGHTPATHISIHFLRPIQEGETIKAVARIINESRNSLLAVVDIHGSDKKQKAHAVILFSKPRRT